MAKNIRNLLKNRFVESKMPISPPEIGQKVASDLNVENLPDTEIETMLEDLKARGGKLESQKILNANTLNELKISLLKDIFDAMSQMGVDPSDLASVSAFLQELERQDPDLAALFQMAIEGVMKMPGQGFEEMQAPVSEVPEMMAGTQQSVLPVGRQVIPGQASQPAKDFLTRYRGIKRTLPQ